MQLDPALAEILASLDPSAETPVEEMAPEDARATWKEEMAAVAGKPLPVKSVSTHEAPGPAGPLTVRLYEPEGAGTGPLPILVYYHGGGWIRGDLDTHDDVCRYLCHHAGCLVASVDYRLAPEHRFPPRWTTATPRPSGWRKTPRNSVLIRSAWPSAATAPAATSPAA